MVAPGYRIRSARTILVMMALAAILVPARRATRVDLVPVLRYE
jgi:ABC-type lipoprotein release transport system permease subunit